MAEQIGPYVVVEEISRGGTAIVYRAFDPKRGQHVALKVLHDQGLRSPSVRKRFEREAEALTRLSHPGIVQALGWGTSGRYPFLALELVHGRSLEEVLSEAGPLPVHVAVGYGVQLAKALAHAHDAGVLHRDLKPANVLLTARGRVVITDFGLTRDTDLDHQTQLSEEGSFMGSPGFWAPEQARGDLEALGMHTDVYGLGATVYAMLTARPPLDVRSLPENLMLTEMEPPAPPSRHNQRVDRTLDQLILPTLAKDPAERPPSVAAVGESLESWLRGSMSFYSLRAVVSDRRLWPAALLAAVGLATFAAVLVGLRNPSGEPSDQPAHPAAVDTTHEDSRLQKVIELMDLEPARAEALCTAILADGPHAEAYFYRGVIRFGSERFTQALADFERGIDLNPLRASLHANRGYVLYNLERFEDAVESLSRSFELDPSDHKPLLCRGDAHYYRGALLEALGDYQRLTRIVPDDPAGWERTEAALRALGRDQAAQEAWARYLTLSQDPSPAYVRRAKAASMRGELPLAVSLLERAQVVNPRDTEILTVLGEARMRLGDTAGALDALNLALRVNPQATRALRTRGIVYRALKKLEASNSDLSQVLATDPNNVLAAYNRGLNAMDLELRSVALRDFQRVLKLEPRHYGALTGRANVHRLNGEFELAKQDVEFALQFAPNRSLPYATRAILLEDLKQLPAALNDWKRAYALAETLAEQQLAERHIRALSR